MTTYVNIADLTELPKLIRGEVVTWIDKESEFYYPNNRVDEVYLPLEAEDEEQLQARKELLQDEKFTKMGRAVRMKEGPTPTKRKEELKKKVQKSNESLKELFNS